MYFKNKGKQQSTPRQKFHFFWCQYMNKIQEKSIINNIHYSQKERWHIIIRFISIRDAIPHLKACFIVSALALHPSVSTRTPHTLGNTAVKASPDLQRARFVILWTTVGPKVLASDTGYKFFGRHLMDLYLGSKPLASLCKSQLQ